MHYLFFAIIGYILLGIVNIFDKFILTKAIKQPLVFVFYSTALVLPIFLFLPFGVLTLESPLHYFIASFAGIFFGLALWAMYKGFQESEVSHGAPLLGASTPFFVLILSVLFLREQLSGQQLVGIIILVIGSVMISFEKSRRHKGLHAGLLYIVLSGFLYAVSHVASKYIYDIYGFYSGLVWTRGFMALFGICLLFIPMVRREIFCKDNSRATKASINELNQKTSRPRQILLVVLSRVLAVVAVVIIQYAIAIGSVTIVNALAGAQFAFIIVTVMLLTKFVPKIFKEKFIVGEFEWEMISVLIIAIGMIVVIT
ncbi:MAG: EamA family transporter [bacterium]